jgi:hypothetical protein
MTAVANLPALDNSSAELTTRSLKDFGTVQLPDEKLIRWDERDECPIDTVRGMYRDELRIHQIQFRPGEWIEIAECAASLSAARGGADDKLPEEAFHRFDAKTLAPMARVCARRAALRIVEQSLARVVGVGGVPAIEAAPFEAALRFAAVREAQAGLLADMDLVADAL